MSRRKPHRLNFFFLACLVLTSGLPMLNLALVERLFPFGPFSLQSPLQAAPSNLIDLSGQITVVDEGGRMVARIATAEGRTYVITGKLEKMIRDQYAGQTVRLSGKIEQEPTGGKPGIFRVESIAVHLN